MAQTSVEWLEERLLLSLGDELKSLRGFFVIAKEMHKEECENAWMDGFDFNSNYKDFEDYYNKTYNK